MANEAKGPNETEAQMELISLFESIGISNSKAKETAQNKKLASFLKTTILSTNSSPIDPSVGSLLYFLASTVTPAASKYLINISLSIKNHELNTTDQISAAIKYASALKSDQTWNSEDFNSFCGVGISISPQQISECVKEILDKNQALLQEKKHSCIGQLIALTKQSLKWANAQLIKKELDAQLLQLLGPPSKEKIKKPVKPTSPATNTPKTVQSARNIFELAKSNRFIFEGELAKLHKPGENPQLNSLITLDHLKRTGAKVITRFPPEPNGFLHIGHAKAININFGYAQAFGGTTNLRYDDTNPEAEEEIYFTAILDTVKWLGFEPSQITYSSDYFQKLFDLACELIKRDKAYICYCTGEEIFEHRGGEKKGPRSDCKHRNRPIEESMAEFMKMKQGGYKEGEAILRMKMDMQNPSPQFWDLVAYRVLKTAHFRTADEWCIYPTYDYTHCLCDSFEDITHSLCTTEFVMSRDSYYWLVDALEIYKPVQWEYGRLNLTHTVLSKRKLNKLVDEKIVNGWDDPRLYTLASLRRRGFTPEAINAFVRDIGVTTSNTVIPVERLETYVRDHLNEISPRLMLLLDPIKLVLTNLSDDHLEMFSVSNKPRDDSMGTREIPFTKTLYIDQSDFIPDNKDPNFFRLSIGKTVGLLNVPHPITAKSVSKDAITGEITVHAVLEKDSTVKPKTYIQWVAESPLHNSPVTVEARLYSNLFNHANPLSKEEVPGGWLSDINPDSLSIKKGFGEVGLLKMKKEDKFQAIRVGYFCVDSSSSAAGIVLNRTCTLKEDSKKDKDGL